MAKPQITYHNMSQSDAMDTRILELCDKLDEFHPKITSCHVVVEEIDKHKHKGNLFDVRIDLHVPGREIVASNQQNEDAYAAIGAAFDAAFRQLEADIEKKRRQVKQHTDRRVGGEPGELTP